jgi:hypothetical protein
MSAYCAMNDGTTAFPSPAGPPGDMTYYITALPQYSKLVPCAQSGLSAALGPHSSELCPEGPQAMASCACLKSGMSQMALSLMSSSVKYYCESSASEDVVSVVSVFDFYCSAARKEVVATGVSESIGQSYATGGGVGASAPAETGKNGGKDGKDGKGGKSGVSIAAIAGGVVGVVGAVAIVGALVFFMLRRRKNLKNKPPPTAYNVPPGTSHGSPNALLSDKPELAGTPLSAPPLPPASPHPSVAKMGEARAETVSPVSAYSNAQSAFTPPPPKAAELQGHNAPADALPPMPELQSGAYMAAQQQSTPELHGNQGYAQPHQQYQMRPELAGQQVFGQGQPPQQMYGQPMQQGYAPPPSQPVHEAYGQPVYPQQTQYQYPQAGYYQQPVQQPPRAELHGGWQTTPVQGYQELDGGNFHHAR